MTTYIIAASFETAVEFAERSGINDWLFVRDVHVLTKVEQGSNVTTYGNWDLRSDYMELRREIIRRNLQVIVGKRLKAPGVGG